MGEKRSRKKNDPTTSNNRLAGLCEATITFHSRIFAFTTSVRYNREKPDRLPERDRICPVAIEIVEGFERSSDIFTSKGSLIMDDDKFPPKKDLRSDHCLKAAGENSLSLRPNPVLASLA